MKEVKAAHNSLNTLIIGAALLVGAAQVAAAPITYFGEDTSTSGTLGPNSSGARANFLSGLEGVGNENFESFASGEDTPLDLSFPGSSGNLEATLTGTGEITNSAGFGRFATSGVNFLEVTTGSFVIDFDNPVSAFGFNGIDIGDFVVEQMSLTLTDIAGATSSLVVPHTLDLSNYAQATLFFGFIDQSQSYSRIEFTNAGGDDVFAFDDMVIGDAGQVATPVSEPSTFALLGLGLLALGLKRRPA